MKLIALPVSSSRFSLCQRPFSDRLVNGQSLFMGISVSPLSSFSSGKHHFCLHVPSSVLTSSALWFAGVGRDKPTPEKVEKTNSAGKEGYSLAGMSPGWYYLFAVIEPVSEPIFDTASGKTEYIATHDCWCALHLGPTGRLWKIYPTGPVRTSHFSVG